MREEIASSTDTLEALGISGALMLRLDAPPRNMREGAWAAAVAEAVCFVTLRHGQGATSKMRVLESVARLDGSAWTQPPSRTPSPVSLLTDQEQHQWLFHNPEEPNPAPHSFPMPADASYTCLWRLLRPCGAVHGIRSLQVRGDYFD